jgi:hypothetical protein
MMGGGFIASIVPAKIVPAIRGKPESAWLREYVVYWARPY